jgi:hypothetical protein
VEKLSYPGKFPKVDTPIYGQGSQRLPRYGFDQKVTFFVDKHVDGLPRISPQGGSAPLTGSGPTSGVVTWESVQMYGFPINIHTIHSPYYYYESHILFNK